jgi:hypothetical protein
MIVDDHVRAAWAWSSRGVIGGAARLFFTFIHDILFLSFGDVAADVRGVRQLDFLFRSSAARSTRPCKPSGRLLR